MIDAHTGAPACGSRRRPPGPPRRRRIKADVCSWFELDPHQQAPFCLKIKNSYARNDKDAAGTWGRCQRAGREEARQLPRPVLPHQLLQVTGRLRRQQLDPQRCPGPCPCSSCELQPYTGISQSSQFPGTGSFPGALSAHRQGPAPRVVPLPPGVLTTGGRGGLGTERANVLAFPRSPGRWASWAPAFRRENSSDSVVGLPRGPTAGEWQSWAQTPDQSHPQKRVSHVSQHLSQSPQLSSR